MKTKIIALLLVLCAYTGYSQNQIVIPPSPNSAALGKYVDNPISYYTGTPDISVPLYSVTSRNFTLPISLSYHAGGIKVEETSSNVGMGWVLNAGGVVTRVVKDIPDDYKAPYCPDVYQGGWPEPDCRNGMFHSGSNIHDIDINDAYNQDLNSDYSSQNIFVRFFNIRLDPTVYSYKKLSDSEPDIFYFNFPGNSGQFVFQVVDGVRTVKVLSDADFEIKHTLDADGKLSQFEITDDKGTVYLFSAIERTSSILYFNSFPVSNSGARNGSIMGVPHTDVFTDYSLTEFNSSWYLEEITTAGGDDIHLSYADEFTLSLNQGATQTLFTMSTNYNTYDPSLNGDFHLVSQSITHLYGKRLETVVSEDILVSFESNHEREDVAGYEADKVAKAITGLTVFSKVGTSLNRIKRFTFGQDYFESPVVNSFPVNDFQYWYNREDDPSTTDEWAREHMDIYFRRLRLRSITEYGTSDNDSLPSTTFEYKYRDFPGYANTDVLPYRFSKAQDLWGYYNGVTGNLLSLIPKVYVYPQMFLGSGRFSVYKRNNFIGSEYTLAGADRLPSSTLMDIGMLTKINYPTGGYTRYEYEPHTFRDGDENFMGGGVRIKNIEKRGGPGGESITYQYFYVDADENSTGRVMSMPIYAMCDGSGYHHSLDGSESAYRANCTRFNQPQAPLGNTRGSNVGYRKVTERIHGSGWTEYEFSVPAFWSDENDLPPPAQGGDCLFSENGTCDGLYATSKVYDLYPYSQTRSSFFNASMNPRTSNTFPFPENPNYDWNRGQLLATRHYNEIGQILRSEVCKYSVWYRGGQSAPGKVYGIKFGQYFPGTTDPSDTWPLQNMRGGCWRVAKYSYLTDSRKVLSSKTITEYEAGTTISATRAITYRHDGTAHANSTQINEQMSNGNELITKYRYSYDYLVSGASLPSEGAYALVKKKIRSIPLEASSFVRKNGAESLISSSLTTYTLANNKAVPMREWMIETETPLPDFDSSHVVVPGLFVKDARYTQKSEVIRYDDDGNPLEVEDNTTGLTTSYIWGYNNRYLLAVVVNATYSEIEAILGSAVLIELNNGYKMGGPAGPTVKLTDDQVRAYLSPLRVGLSKARIVTYTHKPLVGITSEADINARAMYYEYDGLNRLHLIKDHDGNIEKQYIYRYLGQ